MSCAFDLRLTFDIADDLLTPKEDATYLKNRYFVARKRV